MAPTRWIRVVSGTTLLVLLAVGTLTLGFAKAGHTAVGQHIAAEAGQDLGPVDEPAGAGAVLDRHDNNTGEHGPAHLEHGFHLLGVCAAVLAAVLVVLLGRAIGGRRPASAAGRRTSRPATAAAPPGLGPPARTALCVQLC